MPPLVGVIDNSRMDLSSETFIAPKSIPSDVWVMHSQREGFSARKFPSPSTSVGEKSNGICNSFLIRLDDGFGSFTENDEEF